MLPAKSNMDDTQPRTKEEIIFAGEGFKSRLLQLIRHTKQEILISSYIVETDDFGREVFAALSQKAGEGIVVRICVDGYGSRKWLTHLKKLEHGSRIQVRVYHPLPWPFSKLLPTDLTHFHQFFRLMYQANIRNHQKLFIFDKKVVMLGSRNLHNEALQWRETNIVFTGPDVKDAVSVFYNLWDRSHTLGLKRSFRERLRYHSLRSVHLFSNHFPRLRRSRNSVLWKKIKEAKEHIFITTPYFLPQPKLLRLLCQKAKRGVDVKILLPNLIDVKISKWLAQLSYYLMLRSGIKVFEYSGEILHAKTLIVDDWALVGSSNMNHRSAIRDLEIDYSPANQVTIRTLKDRFYKDISKSIIISREVSMNVFARTVSILISKLFPSWF